MIVTPSTPYQKINCSFYDRIEALATQRTHCVIVFRNEERKETTEGIITDLFSKDGAEYLQLDKGTTIRLDRLVSVNGALLSFVC